MPRRKKIESNPGFLSSPLAPPAEDQNSAAPSGAAALDPPPAPAKPRRRRAARQAGLKKKLKRIYSDEDGGPLDMSFFEKSPRRAKTKILFSLLFFLAFLAGLSWLGFFLFNPGQKFSEEKIKLQVDAPDSVSAGSNVTIKINYHNDQRVPLGEASLTVRYPRGFKVSKVEPAAFNKENTEWSLGALTKDRPGAITITGLISGVKDEELPLRVFLNYKPANFNAEFQKILTENIKIRALPIEPSFSGPSELESGQSGDYEITYKNTGEQAVNNLLVKLSAPLGFKINSASPAAGPAAQKTAEAEITTFGPLTINPQEELKIKISGAFTTAAAGGSKIFVSELLLKVSEQMYAQGIISKNTQLQAAAVKLELTANNSAEKQTINFEDKINFAVNYENVGQLSMKNAVIRLVLETPSVDNKSLLNWNALADPRAGTVEGEQQGSGARVGKITWTKKEIKDLAEIKAGDKGVINLTIPVKARKDLEVARLNNWRVKAWSELSVSGQNGAQTIQSNNLELVLVTDLALAAKTTLKETGGQANAYIVNWTLTNTLHEITNVALTAALGELAQWGGVVSVSAGDLSFDKNTNQVIWTINRIPPSFPKTEISFAVSLKTNGVKKESEIMLVDKTKVEAKDKVTGEQITLEKDPLLAQ